MRTFLLAALLLLTAMASAQRPAPPPGSGAATPMPPFMGAPDLSRLAPPGIGFERWWTNPETVNQLHLTETQIKQLEQVTTQQRLALIDALAGGMKAFVLLQPLLDAQQFDEAAANQQLDTMASTASQLVKDFGGSVLATRKILTLDQWRKLQALQRERGGRAPAVGAPLPPRQPRPEGQPNPM